MIFSNSTLVKLLILKYLYIPFKNPIVMKKNQPTQPTLAAFAKSLTVLFNSLFFHDSTKDFQRLKNFIAS